MSNTTKKIQTVVPEVMAPIITAELPKKIRFYPLADVDSTLTGVPGDEVTVPRWEYIGAAEDVEEGEPIPIKQLKTSTVKMGIKKAGIGVDITDEAQLSGMGDPIGEGRKQITLAIADKIDDDIIDAVIGAGGLPDGETRAKQTKTLTGGKLTVAGLESALDIFQDEEDVPTVLICNSADASTLRTDANKEWLNGTEVGANRVVSGVYGEILGVQVVRSNKLEKGKAVIIRSGAVRLMMKRNAEVETGRDIIAKKTVATGDQHYGVYLYDPTKAITVTITA